MIANAAVLAALTTFLLVAWIAGEVTVLAPYRVALFHLHGPLILTTALLVFLHLCAAFYTLARWLFLRDTGRKLTHFDQQLLASDGVHQDVPASQWSTR
jgi:Na+/phosphate symporter